MGLGCSTGRPRTPNAFTGQVLRKLLTAVQFGEVVSYQQLAALAGHPRASRAVGGAMRSNPGGSPRGHVDRGDTTCSLRGSASRLLLERAAS
uniref:Methylated-DNA--protein-cysteine methyltransferase n=1 Tax=Rousettus aegyptiacus TaxID=9407 RepID=A0A7J8GCW9_ROUAE|nr:O-6-methylguanine-DNA methyltransferase [Rousettus aegyptiacus]